MVEKYFTPCVTKSSTGVFISRFLHCQIKRKEKIDSETEYKTH